MSTHIIDATEKALKKTLTLKDGMSSAADLIAAAEPLAANGIGFDSQPALKLRKAENRLRKAYSEVEMAARDLASSIHYVTESHEEAKASQGDLFDEKAAEEPTSATESETDEAPASQTTVPMLPPAPGDVSGDGAASSTGTATTDTRDIQVEDADIEDAEFEDVTDASRKLEAESSIPQRREDLHDVDLDLAGRMEDLPASGPAFAGCLKQANAPTLVFLLALVVGTRGNKGRKRKLEKALAEQPIWNTVALAFQCQRLWAIEELRARYLGETGRAAIVPTASPTLAQAVKETIALLETLRARMLKLGEHGYEVSDERVKTNETIRRLRTAIPSQQSAEESATPESPDDRTDVDAMQVYFEARLRELEEKAQWVEEADFVGAKYLPRVQEQLVLLQRDFTHWRDQEAPNLAQGQFQTNLDLDQRMKALNERLSGVTEAA